MFGWRTSYKKVIGRLALQAMALDPMQAPGLATPSEKGNSYAYNALEGIAAIHFLSQRALRVVVDSGQFTKAHHHLDSVFFSGLERKYSKNEMRNLVMPLLERRRMEYETILDRPGDLGAQLRQLGRVMISHFVEGNVDDQR